MKLEAPLLNLISRCETVCVADCCGLDAYDLSPIHIASYLIMYRGVVDERELGELRTQLGALKANYGSKACSASGVGIDEMNQSFTGEGIDRFVDEIEANLAVALELVSASEQGRYNRSLNTDAGDGVG